METLLSVVLGEAITRCINFFIGKCSKVQAQEVEGCLRRVLLWAQVIMDEAMGRQITNQAMLLQLDMLRGAMHRGYYMLDTFTCKSHGDEEGKDQLVSQYLSLFEVNSLKDLCYLNKNTLILDELQKELDNLSSMILDMEEVVMFLASYRRMYCQPYSMHLLLGNCMFGRQMEAEHAIQFLLHTQPHAAEDLKVLPVVGPARVGKSTLIDHVCKDEKVCDYFSEILWLRDHDFTDDGQEFREGCEMKLQNCMTKMNKDERLLVVVDLEGDLTEDAWNMLYFAAKRCVPKVNKIIVTSRSDKVLRFGTNRVITLKYLPIEAFWYFFKTIAFGCMDPEMHPGHVQVAMEIARMLKGGINGAHVIASLLRENFDIHFWCKIRTFSRGFMQKNISKFGEHPNDLLSQNRPLQLGRMAVPSEEFLVSHQHQCYSHEEIPKIRMQDVINGSIKAPSWKIRYPTMDVSATSLL